jgi:hypothetical protein
MICELCQSYILEDSRFCPKCGVRLWTPPLAKRPWRWIILILLCAVIWSVVVRKFIAGDRIAVSDSRRQSEQLGIPPEQLKAVRAIPYRKSIEPPETLSIDESQF